MTAESVVRGALAGWLVEANHAKLEIVEVLSKHATSGDYLSITFASELWFDRPESAARAFVADLMTLHPELGGPHLMFWGKKASFATQADAQGAADRACAFARDYLAEITRTRGTHKLYVGLPEVQRSGVTIWILRSDSDATELALDETVIAAEIASAYSGPRVTFIGDYCK